MKLPNTKIIFAAILVTLLIFVSSIFGKQNRTVTSEKALHDLEMIKSGDLVFRQGRGIFSELFRNIGDVETQFSHVGIVYKEKKGVFAIHTEANELTGVGFAKIEPLSNFVSNHNAIRYAFYRIEGLDNKRTKAVLRETLKYVRDKIPFDSDFNLRNSDRLYCTELVYKAYKSAGIRLVGKPSIIQLPGFSNLKNFEAITIGQLVESPSVQFIKTQK